MMLSLLFILLLAKGIDSGRFEWHCSAFDSATDRFSLPNLEAQDDAVVHQLALENKLVTSSPGLTYIYPVPSDDLNCSGTVRSIEYCYSASVLHEGNENHVFTLSMLEENDRSFRVLDTTEVYTMPTFGKCTQSQGTSTIYCCDVKSLIEMDQFRLPAPNFAFGITLPSSAVTLLLGFSPIFRPFIVRHYQTNRPLSVGSTLNLNSDNKISDQALKLLRFRIQPNSVTQSSTPAMGTETQPNINETFTPNNGPTPTREASTNEGPDYSTIPSGIKAITIEGNTPAVANQSSSGLSTVAIASIAAVGGSAIMFSLVCALVLAIVIAKIKKRNNTSAMDDLTIRQSSVPTNNHVETDVDSLIFDNEIYSTAPKM